MSSIWPMRRLCCAPDGPFLKRSRHGPRAPSSSVIHPLASAPQQPRDRRSASPCGCDFNGDGRADQLSRQLVAPPAACRAPAPTEEGMWPRRYNRPGGLRDSV
eukprot:scaffold2989_cov387-Prasinococcus_capsulatus_cf.AAC.3